MCMRVSVCVCVCVMCPRDGERKGVDLPIGEPQTVDTAHHFFCFKSKTTELHILT